MRDLIRRLTYKLWHQFDKWNERHYDIKSSGNIAPEQLGFATGDEYRGGLYRPSSWTVLRHLFKQLRVSGDDVFVDYGSGMGRVMIIAAQQPFRRVLGVEMSEELNDIARENLDRNRDRLRCPDVEVISADATQWQVPDDLTIAYFYCPFPPHVFEEVLQQLFASLERRPRPLRLVYFFMSDPDRDLLMATGRAKELDFKRPLHLRGQLSELWMFELR
jgi:histone methylation protein DOT1